jgi:uncharacterized protein
MKVRYLRLVRRAFRTLRHPRLRHRPWWQKISKPLFDRSLWMPCRDTVASGLAIGLFFSMVPLIPQSIFAAIIAMRARANVPFAIAACFVSNPITNGPFWAAQIWLGKFVIDFFHLPIPAFFEKVHVNLPVIGNVSMCDFIVGFIALGTVMALCAYPIVHVFSAILPHHLPVRRQTIKVLD